MKSLSVRIPEAQGSGYGMGIEAVEPPGILAPAVAVVDRAEHAHRRAGLVAEGAGGALDVLQPAAEVLGVALLDKSAGERNPPFPGYTYPAATVIGMPSAVKRLRTATRIWTSATWRSNSRDISRWPSSFTQFIFVSTLLRRWYPLQFRQSARPR